MRMLLGASALLLVVPISQAAPDVDAGKAKVAQVCAGSRDSALVPATANGRWANRNAGGATANDSLELA